MNLLEMPSQTVCTAQQFYLSPQGQILSSDDTLFNTTAWQGVSVLEVFPVIESCYPLFFQPDNIGFREFQLPAVQLSKSGIDAFFDFYFLKIWYESREAIFWWMEDRTDFYTAKQQVQQVRNQQFLLEEKKCNHCFAGN